MLGRGLPVGKFALQTLANTSLHVFKLCFGISWPVLIRCQCLEMECWNCLAFTGFAQPNRLRLWDHWYNPLYRTDTVRPDCIQMTLNFFHLFYFLQLNCPSGISPMGNSGCRSLGKASCDRVALPNLRWMLDVLVFEQSTELWHGLRDL